MMHKVRVRFAPSPTGPLHIGGVRTALYNYLFAKKHHGVFILRIEDTDQARFVEGAEGYIIEALRWCGITVDEGINEGGNYAPYRQSERKEIYRQYADMLVEKGDAYYAFDTPDQLEKMREAAVAEGRTFIYNASNRGMLHNSLSMKEDECERLLASGEQYVIRYKMPAEEEIHFNDLIRGNMVVNTGTLDDKVLFKSDGMPTYHLANIVDDHLMEISHVIRGEEWLPSLPLHVLMYRSFGCEVPAFAHLPLILKPDGKGKLSKRDGDKMGFPVFPLYWPYGETAKGYREEGYYPEAFINMLALLGWNPGTEKEIFSMEELIEAFSIERVHKAGSRFDPDKARWFNHIYLQQKENKQLAIEFREFLRARGFHYDIIRLEKLVAMVKERVSFVKDLWTETDFFFESPDAWDKDIVAKRWKPESPVILAELRDTMANLPDFSAEETEKIVKSWIEAKGYSTGLVMNSLRLVVVGALRGPHLFDIISWIGREETLIRIDKGIDTLGQIQK
ncbi:MAG: glutamate--tRNA ligase [Bacteroidales bacterium]|nr:glutamate--tRNA ligase [Bacteroidales bacterium]MBN2632214.1 glutamate--tRNA ligase [Bacteroidales bacterium]